MGPAVWYRMDRMRQGGTVLRLQMPRCFRSFRCAADRCPDTCCRDWAVMLDADTAAYYRTVPGPLGAALASALGELDGEPCLTLRGGLCPMLDGRGLCTIQLQLGEERLCAACRLHPRFAEEYGSLREWCLTAACPEAARLLLTCREPMALEETVTDEPVSGCNDLNARRFYALKAAREAAFAIVQRRDAPWQARVGWLLAFSRSVQRSLDGRRPGRAEQTAARYRAGRRPAVVPGTGPDGADAAVRALRDLEPINDRWRQLLDVPPLTAADRSRFAAADGPWQPAYEHLLWYFVYRYFLKAVTDGRLLARVQLAVFSVLAVRELTAAHWPGGAGLEQRIDVLHRYSRTAEHSAENLAALLDRLETDPALSPRALTAAAW